MKLKPSKPLRRKWVNKETKHMNGHQLPRQPPPAPAPARRADKWAYPHPSLLVQHTGPGTTEDIASDRSRRQQCAVGVVGGQFRFVRPLPETRIHLMPDFHQSLSSSSSLEEGERGK